MELGRLLERGVEVPADGPRARALFEQACDAKEPAGCDALAMAYENGFIVPADEARAKQYADLALGLYEERCARDHGESCWAAGLELEFRRRDGDALARQDQACKLGNVDGCAAAASLVEDGRGAKVDFQRAFDYQLRACDLGEPSGCESAAIYVGDYGTLPRDAERERELEHRARQMHDDACAKKADRYGCFSAGLAWEYTDPRDEQRATTSYRLACDAGDMFSCGKVATRLRQSDATGAVALFQRACEKGDESSCRLLHAHLKQEQQPAEAEAVATRLRDLVARDCDRGSAYACTKLADLYRKGDIIPADPARLPALRARILDLERKSCRKTLAWSCATVAKMLEEDAGGKPVGTTFYEEACALGEESACLVLAERTSGERSDELRERACELGEMDACRDGRYDEPDEENPCDGLDEEEMYGDMPGDDIDGDGDSDEWGGEAGGEEEDGADDADDDDAEAP